MTRTAKLPLLLAAAVALLLPSTSLAQPIEVVSVVGEARLVGGGPLKVGDRFAGGRTVKLARHAVAQLVLDGRLALSLCRGAEALLLDRQADVVLTRGVARLAGVGSVSRRRLRLELGFPAGGEALVAGPEAFVVAGNAVARSVGEERGLRAGQSVRLLGDGGLALGQRRVDDALLRETRSYAPPAPWEPRADPVALDREVKKVRQRVQSQQQRDREMASCGCTEGSGPGAQIDRSRGSEIRPETRPARVRVKVLGVPKKL